MFFDTHYWPLALVFALISVAITFGLTFGIRDRPSNDYRRSYRDDDQKPAAPKSSLSVALLLTTFVVDLILQRFDFYYMQPQLTGSFFGYFTPLLFAFVPAAALAFIFKQNASVIVRALAPAFLLFAWPTAQYIYNAWGPTNAKAFADLANVTIAGANETIPPTDEQHLILVTQDMAKLKAQTILSSKGNYSSRYAIGELTLQAIHKHRYYAAPLVPTNSKDTFWTPLTGGVVESPGYVLVDAEDKEAQPELHDEFHMTLFSDMPFGMNLDRFAYQQGYTKGDLNDETFEVDDDYQPHWTMTYIVPAFGNITGEKLSKVLVVDVAKSEPVLHAYDEGDPAIKWVDRVISSSLVKAYAHDWGVYGQAYSNTGFGAWLQVAMGFSKQDTMVPAEGDQGQMLSYTKEDENIWVVPMTSQNSTDHGVLGVLVFDTDRNKAKFYPGLRGFNHGGSVAQTMMGVLGNTVAKYDIENLELYNIYGHLTWVAIYTRSQTLGSTFGAIGFMDARAQQVSDVAYGQDLQTALADYANKLAQGSNGMGSNGMGATQANATVTFVGKIWRIAPNGTTWRFQLVGDSKRYYDVNAQTYPGTPLLRDGDEVKGAYMDTHQALSAVRALTLVGDGAGDSSKK